MSPIISRRSFGRHRLALIPKQPRPIAETSSPRLPGSAFALRALLAAVRSGHSRGSRRAMPVPLALARTRPRHRAGFPPPIRLAPDPATTGDHRSVSDPAEACAMRSARQVMGDARIWRLEQRTPCRRDRQCWRLGSDGSTRFKPQRRRQNFGTHHLLCMAAVPIFSAGFRGWPGQPRHRRSRGLPAPPTGVRQPPMWRGRPPRGPGTNRP